MPTQKDQLIQAFQQFKRLPFPSSASNDELNLIHAELAEYDGFIAGTISSLLSGSKFSRGNLKFEQSLADRLENILSTSKDTKVLEQARKYLSYLEAIKNILEEAWRLISNQELNPG